MCIYVHVCVNKAPIPRGVALQSPKGLHKAPISFAPTEGLHEALRCFIHA